MSGLRGPYNNWLRRLGKGEEPQVPYTTKRRREQQRNAGFEIGPNEVNCFEGSVVSDSTEYPPTNEHSCDGGTGMKYYEAYFLVAGSLTQNI